MEDLEGLPLPGKAAVPQWELEIRPGRQPGAVPRHQEVSISFHANTQFIMLTLSTAPAWAGMGGSRTPAWKQDGSRTSNPYDGSQTAYGGFGSRTPAWNAGARTPYVGSGNSDFDAFAAGSRTPAWGSSNAGNRTPAWAGASASNGTKDRGYDAPTPGGYSAPTPGAYGSAPTPGVSAPTPGAWADSAPTPGAFNAPTPGDASKRPYDAPTPAAFDNAGGSRPYDAPTPALGGSAATPGAGAYGDGDDGGPRYEEGTPSP